MLERVRQEQEQANIYREKLAKHDQQANCNYNSSKVDEIINFRELRKSALFSVKRYCYDKGFKYSQNLFEDAFQEGYIHYLTYQEDSDKWLSEHELPLQALLNKYTRQAYARLCLDSVSDSLDTLLEEALSDNPAKADTAFYRAISTLQVDYQDILFFDSLDRILTDRQKEVVMLILSGYTNKEETNPKYTAISKKLNISKTTVQEHIQNVRIYLACGGSEL